MDVMKLTPEELGKGSPIRLERCGSEYDIYWKMALEMLDLIKENNAKGKTTFMIVPYGPLGGYSVGGVCRAASIRMGGDDMRDAILRYVRRKHGVLIGENMAEDAKIRIGSLRAGGDRTCDVRGRALPCPCG